MIKVCISNSKKFLSRLKLLIKSSVNKNLKKNSVLWRLSNWEFVTLFTNIQYIQKGLTDMNVMTILKLLTVLAILVSGLIVKRRIGNRQFNYWVLSLQTLTLALYFTDTFSRIGVSLFTFDTIFWSILALGIVFTVDSMRIVTRLALINILMNFVLFNLVAFFLGHV